MPTTLLNKINALKAHLEMINYKKRQLSLQIHQTNDLNIKNNLLRQLNELQTQSDNVKQQLNLLIT